MPHYIAIIEDSGPDTAVGVWFPDLPGCFSAGDSVDEAMANAQEALIEFAAAGGSFNRPRTLSELRLDPETAKDIANHMVALVPFRQSYRPAAE